MKTYAYMSRLATTFAVGLLALLAACSRTEKTASIDDDAPGEKRWPLHGQIVSVDAAHKTLRVQHEEIVGLMPAMTMDYAVGPGDLANARAGEHIRGELVQSGGDFRLERIFPDDASANATIDAAAKSLGQDTMVRGPHPFREVGETAPDFALYDQDGHVVQMNRFRGKQIMLNFIYTRCPIATMCPASTAKMIMTQKLAREAGVKNLELISISLDPVYDTPGVLKDYAQARGIDLGNFSFLTGPQKAVQDLLAQFGVIAEFKDGILNHTLATLLINENGTIIWRADGGEWEPSEFVGKMRK
ncbi:MAG TPA: SCO family protein [Opitutaceae bacterium]|jgi:protein SCO1/2|nr:SCO family protein [Opitutaceae bacterium]